MDIHNNSFVFQILTSEKDILAAKKLVYKVYIDTFGWAIDAHNPSKLTVSENNGERYLTDRYSSCETWLGIKQNGELVATFRVLSALDGKFEVEQYSLLPTFLKSPALSAEINRLAILPEFTNSDVFPLLLEKSLEYCVNRGLNYIFSAVEFPSPGEFFTYLGAKKIAESSFQYSASDPKPVSLIFLDISNSLENEKRKNILSRLYENKEG